MFAGLVREEGFNVIREGSALGGSENIEGVGRCKN